MDLMKPYDENNIFARILRNEAPAIRVYEDEMTLAFMDIMPQLPGHVLVIPKEPLVSINDINADNCNLVGHLLLICKKVAEQERLSNGYRVVANTGKDGGQSVEHLHFHVLGGRSLSWPPGSSAAGFQSGSGPLGLRCTACSRS